MMKSNAKHHQLNHPLFGNKRCYLDNLQTLEAPFQKNKIFYGNLLRKMKVK